MGVSFLASFDARNSFRRATVRPLSKTCNRTVIFSLQKIRNRITDSATLEHVASQAVAHLNLRMLFAHSDDVGILTRHQKSYDGVFDLGCRDGFTQTFSIACFDKQSFGSLNNTVFHDGDEMGIERHKKESGINRSLYAVMFP